MFLSASRINVAADFGRVLFRIVRGVEMKAKRTHLRSEKKVLGNEQVRVEMYTFLQALDSYPTCFATNPEITFDEHCVSLMALAQVAPIISERSNPCN